MLFDELDNPIQIIGEVHGPSILRRMGAHHWSLVWKARKNHIYTAQTNKKHNPMLPRTPLPPAPNGLGSVLGHIGEQGQGCGRFAPCFTRSLLGQDISPLTRRG